MKIRQIVLSSRPIGIPVLENFRFEEQELDKLSDNQVLLKPLYISVDPYMRGRMSSMKSYSAPFEINKPIYGGIVARVIESRSDSFSAGETVFGMLPWSTYCTMSAEKLRKVDIQAFPPTYYLGVLGMPGLTAYFGITDIGKPKSGENVVISGAAGAVGVVAGQISKKLGAFVVGVAGSDIKCKLLEEQFGFDATVNYKTTKSIRKDISVLCPGGVDVYFDNVGGSITDAVIENLNFHSRIVLCGQISHYNVARVPMGPVILPKLLTRSVLLKGFIVRDYSDRFDEGLKQLMNWVSDGTIKYTETIVPGFDRLPQTFLDLFIGKNQGKMLVEIE